MGRSFSKPTVLECMLNNFKKGFLGDYGIKMSSRRLCTLHEFKWLTFVVNRSLEGTLDLPTVRAIYQVIIGAPISSPISTPGIRWLRPYRLVSNSAPTKRDRAEFSWTK
jgi:hypothetical protein